MQGLLQVNPEKRLDYSELWQLPFWTATLNDSAPETAAGATGTHLLEMSFSRFFSVHVNSPLDWRFNALSSGVDASTPSE